MRCNFFDMKVKDLPHPGQRWVVFDRLLMVTRVGVDRYRETLWWVNFDWIHEDGNMRFYPYPNLDQNQNPSSCIHATGSGSLELGRFLYKAERQSQ